MNARSLQSRLLPALLALSFWSSAARAQTASSFASTQEAFHQQLLTSAQLLTEQYLNALERLELDHAAKGELHAALTTQKERTRLAEVYLNADASLADTNAISLSSPGARMSGVTTPDEETYTGWRSSSSYVEWTNVPLPPGSYELELEYLVLDAPIATTSEDAQPAATAEFAFSEVSQLADSSGTQMLELPSARTAGEYQSLKLGPISYKSSPVTLKLAPTQGYPGNVIWIRRPRLVPVAAAPSPSQPQPQPLSDSIRPLSELKQDFRADLALSRAAVIERHRDALADLGKAHPEWKSLLQAEDRRADRQRLRDPEISTPLLPAPMSSLGGIAGFEMTEGVYLIPDPSNTGDEFLIGKAGKEWRVKLLWVDCAPPQGGSPSAFSKHFKIDPQDAALFGRAAADFTLGYLEDRPLRILTRGSLQPDELNPALLFLPGLGLFQNLLIEHGLAAATTRSDADRPTLERALLNSLHERETAARSRTPRVGVWNLSPLPMQARK